MLEAMPIAVEAVRGAELPEITASWTAEDIALYNLAVGAGDPPDDPKELEYVLEPEPKVLPSYAVLPALGQLFETLSLPGMEVNLGQLLHGEQELELHAPIPSSGSVRTKGTITDVIDKGKAAVVLIETVSRLADSEEPLFTNRFTAFFRGEGGFGGQNGAARNGDSPGPQGPPNRPPDRTVRRPTLSQQALLYRMSGDRNPLHADPEFARKAGFERPILHGLCTFGIACKAVVDSCLDGDVTRVSRYSSRFSGIFYPGEELEVAIWESDSRIDLAAGCVERDAPVLTNAVIETR
jgi:acyl dehydratase